MKKILFMSKGLGGSPPITNLLEFDVNNTIIAIGSLSNVIGSNWNVVRNSIASYAPTASTVAKVGINIARIENGKVLIENQITNFVIASEDLANATFWNNSGFTITLDGAIVAPDGTLTANRLSSASGNISSAGYLGLQDTMNKSLYARAVSVAGNYVILGHNSVGRNSMSLTLEWQRFNLQADTGESFGNKLYPRDNRAGLTGDILIWGIQAEVGISPTSYMPTLTTSADREADVITVTVPVGATSSETWINGISQGKFIVVPGDLFTMVNATTKINMDATVSTEIAPPTNLFQRGGEVDPTTEIYIRWDKTSNPTTNIRIYVDGALWKTNGDVASGNVVGLTTGRTYTITVRAWNGINESSDSNSITATTA